MVLRFQATSVMMFSLTHPSYSYSGDLIDVALLRVSSCFLACVENLRNVCAYFVVFVSWFKRQKFSGKQFQSIASVFTVED
jgi:hypothetical protein